MEYEYQAHQNISEQSLEFVAMRESENRNNETEERKLKQTKILFSLNSKLPRFIVFQFGFIPLFYWENIFIRFVCVVQFPFDFGVGYFVPSQSMWWSISCLVYVE